MYEHKKNLNNHVWQSPKQSWPADIGTEISKKRFRVRTKVIGGVKKGIQPCNAFVSFSYHHPSRWTKQEIIAATKEKLTAESCLKNSQ